MTASKITSKKAKFKSNEYIVYPAHGVGKVMHIEEQEIAGAKLELYVIDFAKDKIFVEIQFGNSSTVYRDFYKFHLGFDRRVLDLGVLIAPTDQYAFFPQRNPRSIQNMATYEYALEHFEAITVPVPILLIGLLPKK